MQRLNKTYSGALPVVWVKTNFSISSQAMSQLTGCPNTFTVYKYHIEWQTEACICQQTFIIFIAFTNNWTRTT